MVEKTGHILTRVTITIVSNMAFECPRHREFTTDAALYQSIKLMFDDNKDKIDDSIAPFDDVKNEDFQHSNCLVFWNWRSFEWFRPHGSQVALQPRHGKERREREGHQV